MNKNRVLGYDLARSSAVIFVFVAHIVLAQTQNSYISAFYTSISPGITMSLLGFISAVLLVNKKNTLENYPIFFFRRIVRIFVPVFLVLTFAAILMSIYKVTINKEHLIYHYLGLSLFFDWFRVPNEASIGWGLWFVTAIVIMYILLPILYMVFTHKNGLIHLIVYCAVCIGLNMYILPPETSFWNVAVSFGCGVYIAGNKMLDKLIHLRKPWVIISAGVLLAICLLSSSGLSAFDFRLILYPVYPLVLLPLSFFVASFISKKIGDLISAFSRISFEFYMLQFYFINGGFVRIFGENHSLASQIIIGFIVSTFIAFILEKISMPIKKGIESYFIKTSL